jgi:hypothetical protein
MAAVVITMSGDDSRLRAAHERMLADQQKLLDKYSKLGETSKKLSDEEIAALQKKASEEKAFQKLQERATKNIKDITTAYESYSAELIDANEQRKKGLLTEEQYARVMNKLKQELRDNTGETKKLQAAGEAQARAVMKADEITKRYRTNVKNLKIQLNEVKKAYDEGTVDLETYTRAQEALNEAQGSTGFDDWAKGLAGVAAGYFSVNAAIGLVVKSMEDQKRFQKESLDANTRLGMAQEEAVQNFVGMEPAEFQKAIDAPKAIADEVGIKDVAWVTEALTAAYSATGDLEKAIEATRAASRTNRLHPEKIPDIAVGTATIADKTGSTGDEASGFILNVQKESPVTDPRQTNAALTPVVSAATNMYPALDKKEVSNYFGALWAKMANMKGDKRGESSATATITLASKIKEIFDNLRDPESEDNKKLNQEIEKLEKSLEVTEKEKQGIKSAETAVAKATKALAKSAPESSDHAKLVDAKEKAEVNLRDRQTRSTLNTKEMERLDSLRKEKASLNAVVDPGTPQGQAETVRNTPVLMDRLFQTAFGEEQFKPIMKAIMTKGSEAAADLSKISQTVSFDDSLYQQTVKNTRSATPSLMIAQAGNDAEAASNKAKLENTQGAAVASIEGIMDKALIENRYAGVSDLINESMFKVAHSAIGTFSGENTEYAARMAAGELSARRSTFMIPDSNGLNERDIRSIVSLTTNLEALAKTVEAVMGTMTESQRVMAQQTVDKIRRDSANAVQRIEQTSVSAAARIQAAKAGQ